MRRSIVLSLIFACLFSFVFTLPMGCSQQSKESAPAATSLPDGIPQAADEPLVSGGESPGVGAGDAEKPLARVKEGKGDFGSSDSVEGAEGEALPPPEAPSPGDSTVRGADKALTPEEAVEEDSFGVSEKRKPSTPVPGRRKSPVRKPAASGLKAGFSDDNQQFNYFLQFLRKYNNTPHLKMLVDERIIIRVSDKNGKSAPNAEVSVFAQGKLLEKGKTLADGSYLFFPSGHGAGLKKYVIRVNWMQKEKNLSVDRFGPRNIKIAFDTGRQAFENVPVDIVFILDTTGSMGEEIDRLKKTIEIINMNIAAITPRPRVRFGMVLYRDRSDKYLTRVIGLTENLEAFNKKLQTVRAGGGGDRPEDLNSALFAALTKLDWNKDGLRLGFVITDAPPQLGYAQDYGYTMAAKDAKAKGIKLFTIGTGGLDLAGEYALRQIAQYTSAKYIFLTYGEKGESAGGRPGSVSHHTGHNWAADKLESIIIRAAKEELSQLSDRPLQDGEAYFTASRMGDEQAGQTLGKLFTRAVGQLKDYSAMAIPEKTPAAVLPISPADKKGSADAEYFTEHLILAFSRDPGFTAVERKDLQKLLEELSISQSGLVDEKNAVKAGEMLGAQMVITGRMHEKPENFILFLKLVNVGTGEILSVTKLLVSKDLGTG